MRPMHVYLKGNAVTDRDFKADINGNTLSEVETVPYLGVTFSNNAKWTTHAEDIFRMCVRLLFLSRNFVGY